MLKRTCQIHPTDVPLAAYFCTAQKVEDMCPRKKIRLIKFSGAALNRYARYARLLHEQCITAPTAHQRQALGIAPSDLGRAASSEMQ